MHFRGRPARFRRSPIPATRLRRSAAPFTPPTHQALQLNFKTQTYDVEVGDAIAAGTHQVFTFGGNVRQNNFNITIAPTAENRTELGAYVQDQILLERFDFNIGGRIDKFGNLSDPVFSPRLAATFKPRPDQGIRFSFNRAFRAPSVINNYLDTRKIGRASCRERV